MSQSKHELFTQAIKENEAQIRRICAQYANSSSQADDLFQEVAMNLWQSLDRFEGRSKMSTWVYRITLNICMKYYRSKKKHHHQPLLDQQPSELEKDNSHELMLLRKCIQGLNEADKSIVMLYLEEVAYKEIAEITGLSENHVAVKIKRIKKKLESCIRQKL